MEGEFKVILINPQNLLWSLWCGMYLHPIHAGRCIILKGFHITAVLSSGNMTHSLIHAVSHVELSSYIAKSHAFNLKTNKFYVCMKS